jgi:ribosome recycling factor
MPERGLFFLLFARSVYTQTNTSHMYDFSSLTTALADIQEHFTKELAGIRTGQAAPAILDTIQVDAYGTLMPLKQVGSITIEDARTLRVSAWDAGQVKAIEHALQSADLGVSISTDEKGVRVSFPELTSERRDQLTKLTKSKLEDARAAVRRARDETWQDIQKLEKDKELSEDEKFSAKEKMETQIQNANKALEEGAKRKETELAA